MPFDDPRKAPRQDRAKVTVSAVLDATAHILASEGVAGVNTNRVAEIAGVSIGSLYQYFPNKNALIGALAVRNSEATFEVLKEAMQDAEGDDLGILIRKLIRATISAHAANPKLRRAIIEALPRIERPARLKKLNTLKIQLVLKCLSAHRETIRVSNLEVASNIIVQIVEHLIHMAYAAPDGFPDLRQIAPELERLVMGYLTA